MKVVESILRPGGGIATRSLVCRECGCRAQNLVRFTDGTNGYACRWNSHPTHSF